MDDPVDLIDGIAVLCRLRRFDAAPLIDGHIRNDASRFHGGHHLPADNDGRFGAGDENAADYPIGVPYGILDILVIGTERREMAVQDLLQTKHALRRNFPLVARLRYGLEAIGPELRQYIVSSNDAERPFSRDQRRWVYASAKKENNYFGFGSDSQVIAGMEWAAAQGAVAAARAAAQPLDRLFQAVAAAAGSARHPGMVALDGARGRH